MGEQIYNKYYKKRRVIARLFYIEKIKNEVIYE
nr:MAG TPA: hypothetical protein [Caudoviricetes sp.]